MKNWIDIESLCVEVDTSILIKEPPCSNCLNWKPHKDIQQFADGSIVVCGITCCTASSMYKDFSCYEGKE